MSNQFSLEELESVIQKAINKVGGNKENDICKFLPVESGGYMHHFTLRKMKNEEPKTLQEMIQKFILSPAEPNRVPPKPRAARGSRKRRDTITLSKGDLEEIREFMRRTGNQEILAKLSYRRSLAAVKRELIASIRRERVEYDLWNSYVEAIKVQQGEQAVQNATGQSVTIETAS